MSADSSGLFCFRFLIIYKYTIKVHVGTAVRYYTTATEYIDVRFYAAAGILYLCICCRYVCYPATFSMSFNDAHS